MKILVTGGSGMIGTATIRGLIAAGHEVRLLSRHAETAAREYPQGVQPISAAIDDADALAVAVHGCSAIVHVAGILTENPPESTYEKVNIGGTAALLKAATGEAAPFFIYVSSLGAERGSSDYHRSKYAAEELVREFAGPWLILRPGNIYGPGDETVSLLLKMLRALPAVPIVGVGDQRFQPLWCEDFAAALVLAVEQPNLHGRTLEMAGPESTTTADLLRRLGRLTNREPRTINVPTAVAQLGTELIAALGGERLWESLGFTSPLSAPKLQLLLEENELTPEQNALPQVFGVEPTALDDGLAMLADVLPEQKLADGVGALSRTIYGALIENSPLSAADLIDGLAENLSALMPIEFAAEPGTPTRADAGATLTGKISGRGHFQVRVVERAADQFTLMTVEGHPLAGTVTFAAEDQRGRIKFEIRVVSRPADVLDWIALRTVGSSMQSANWRRMVRRAVDFSAGVAPEGVTTEATALSSEEIQRLEAWAENLVTAQKRAENAALKPS